MTVDKLSGGDTALFVSDVHLCDDEPATGQHFLGLLRSWLTSHNHLFILGDLFESWCGDDAPDNVALELISVLKTYSHQGGKIFIMRGNRDFLIDSPLAAPNLTQRFTAQIGAELLNDECPLNVFDEPWILCHGDQLCTLDTAYIAFRRQARDPDWQSKFLSASANERREQAKQMRAASKHHQALIDSTPALYDVTDQAVEAMMASHGATVLLHGHTHKPNLHVMNDQKKRYVLSDWTTRRGDALSVSARRVARLIN
jgi:UDP-2,3-diacylglucosamine hydrolase